MVMMMDTGKTEERAIKAIEDLIDAHDTMESRIKKGDKYMSWDGSIVIYNAASEIRSKKTMDYEIPVQVKGHVDSKEKHLHKQYISHAVDLEDLQLYCDNLGCLYFQIYISEDAKKREIFYNLLFPSKAKSYLERAQKKQNKTKINIPFMKLKKDKDSLYIILKQFSNEVIKQGSGRGQIVPKMIRIDELASIQKFTATAVGVKNEYDFLKRLGSGDVCIYGTLDNGDVEYPIEWTDGGTFYIRKTVNHALAVDETEYYTSYDVQMSSTEEWVLFPSPNIEINLKSGKIHFRPVTRLNDIHYDAEFLLAIEEGKEFVFGNKTRIAYKNAVLPEDLKRKLKFFIELGNTFKKLDIEWNTEWSSLTEETSHALQNIVYFKRGIFNDRLQDKYNLYNFNLDGFYYPIIISRHDKDQENDLYNAAYTEELNAYDTDPNGKPYRVPLISVLDNKVIGKLYMYDYEKLMGQINNTEINIYTANAVLHTGLKMITAYDHTGDERLLEISQYAFDKLKALQEDKDPYLTINALQIKKRVSLLTEDDIILLDTINSDDSQIQLGISILKEDVEGAKRIYATLGEEEKQLINEYPIMFLFKKLMSRTPEMD